MSIKALLVDKSINKIFSPEWKIVRKELNKLGYLLVELDGSHISVPANDIDLAELVLRNFDGILIEHTDFIEILRSNLLNMLVSNEKEVLLIRGKKIGSYCSEFQVYRYDQYGRFMFLEVVSYHLKSFIKQTL